MFFFPTRTLCTASIGPVDVSGQYDWTSCGLVAPTLIRTHAMGSAPDYQDAERNAVLMIQRNVALLTQRAACPVCGHTPAVLTDELARTQATLARHKRLRLPVAAAVVVALFAMLATFAIRDLAYSSGLLVLTIGLSLFSGSLVFLLLSREYKLPAPRWSTELWIWSEARGGAYRSERTWVPATYPTSTLLAQPPPWTLVVGLLSASGALLVVAIGTVRWAESYQTLIVVDAAFDDGPLSVKVDGQPLGEVRSTDKEDDDIAWHQFTIRTGRDRAIDIASASGRQWHYTVDPSERPLLAPGARESHLQFVGSSVTYVRSGTSRPADGFERLSECGDDRLQLRHDYTSKFHPAPDSVMMERGQDKHVEWQLRAFDCDPTHRRPEYTTTFREAREDLKPIPQ